jgi:RHS repeat-associated protein
LLATDRQRSVLNALDAMQPHSLAYTPYGHHAPDGGLLSLLGFSGERPDPVTGHYLLGNGYRAFNPVLMRFNSPDSWSPFGEGGLNAYGYCGGDPVNWVDPTGHAGVFGMLKLIGRKLGLRQSSRVARATRAYEAAIQAPISGQISRSSAVPDGLPPPYSPSAGPSTHSSRVASSQALEAPRPYSQSETHLVAPPPYSPSNGVTSLVERSISAPNLEAPPPYFREQARLVSTARQARIDELRAHRQRVEQAYRGRQLSESAQETIDSLRTQIRNLRQGLAPQSSRQTRMP